MLFWSKKDISKVKNTLLQWISQNILENQQNTSDIYEMKFMQSIVRLVKVDEM